jgi:glycosidase
MSVAARFCPGFLLVLVLGCAPSENERAPEQRPPEPSGGFATTGGTATAGVSSGGADSVGLGGGGAAGTRPLAGDAGQPATGGGSGNVTPTGPACERDLDCAEDERCAARHCAALPCGVHAFVYVPQGDMPESVHVAGSFNGWSVSDYTALERDPQTGHFRKVLDVGEGEQQYKLVINGSDWRLDPGNPLKSATTPQNSLLQTSCPLACNGDAEAFDWRDQTLYSLLIDRFFDSDGQGSAPSQDGTAENPRFGRGGGDLNGVRQKLGYLSDLGVTALWLSSPAQNSPSGYHGYYPSPNDTTYTATGATGSLPAVDARFGSADDLHQLVSQAHGTGAAGGHGMRVLLDYVMKHADKASPLAQAHPDWFYLVNGNPRLCNAGTPDPGDDIWDDPFWGTRCAFGNSLWPFDYAASQAALDWSVRDAAWWAKTYELDGFRLDAIRHVSPLWPPALRAELLSALGAKGSDFYLVGETWDFDPNGLRPLVDPVRRINGQLDFPLRQKLVEALLLGKTSLKELGDFVAVNDGFYGREAVMSTFLGNHDLPRVIHLATHELGSGTEGSNADNDQPGQFAQPTDAAAYERLALAFVAQFTGPGIPVIYYGDEIGLAGGGDPENRRMLPWNEAALSVAQKDLRATVRALAKLRAAYPVLGRGKRETLHVDTDVWLYRRYACADWPSVLVALNRADTSKMLQLPSGNYQDLLSQATLSGIVTLPARGFLLLRAAP